MAQVFLSYTEADRSFAQALADELRVVYEDVNVTFDNKKRDKGLDWAKNLKQIEARDVLIYVVSPDSLQSSLCQAELAEARRLHKQIIAVQPEGSGELVDEHGEIEHVDLSGGVDDPDVLINLLNAVNLHMAKVEKGRHKPLWEAVTPNPFGEDADAKPTKTWWRSLLGG